MIDNRRLQESPEFCTYALVSSAVSLKALWMLKRMLLAFLVSNIAQVIHPFMIIPSALGEISMVFYLPIIGVRIQKAESFINKNL